MTENAKFTQSYEPILNFTLLSDTMWLSTLGNNPEWTIDTQWPSFEVGNLSEWAPVPIDSELFDMGHNTASVSELSEVYVTLGVIYYERVRFGSL
jgi:hypothetical protein